MGNCCAATPTLDNHTFRRVSTTETNQIPRASPHNVGVAGRTGGHMTPDSLPELPLPPPTAEPQELEHIADREGKEGAVALELGLSLSNILLLHPYK